MTDTYGGNNGNYYHQSGGQAEIGRAITNGDHTAAYFLTLNQNHNPNYSGGYYGGGVERKPFEFKLIKKILYLIFIFVPKFIFYYLPFKYFGLTFLMVIFAGLAYMGHTDFGKAKMSEYQWSLEPKNIKFNKIDIYGFDAKLLKKYRSLDSNGLYKVYEKLDDLPVLSQNTFKGVIREKLLQNPEYFRKLGSSPNIKKATFAMYACGYAKSFSNNNAEIQLTKPPFHEQIVMERGYMQFFEPCANPMPATKYYDAIKYSPQYPSVKSELDRLNHQPLFHLTRYHKIIAEWSAILGGFLFLLIVCLSMSHNEKVRKEKTAAKLKKEAEKLEKDERPKEITDFKAKKNLFTE